MQPSLILYIGLWKKLLNNFVRRWRVWAFPRFSDKHEFFSFSKHAFSALCKTFHIIQQQPSKLLTPHRITVDIYFVPGDASIMAHKESQLITHNESPPLLWSVNYRFPAINRQTKWNQYRRNSPLLAATLSFNSLTVTLTFYTTKGIINKAIGREMYLAPCVCVL